MPDARAEEAFAELYQATYGRVVAQVYALSGDLAEAQEVAQDAFLRAWTSWARVAAHDDPAGWVRRVAHNLAVSRWRKARNTARALLRHGPPADVPEPSLATASLVAALAQLPEPARRALVLHHIAGLSVVEIADVEGVAPGTVKARLSRGRAALAPLLAEPACDSDPEVRHA